MQSDVPSSALLSPTAAQFCRGRCPPAPRQRDADALISAVQNPPSSAPPVSGPGLRRQSCTHGQGRTARAEWGKGRGKELAEQGAMLEDVCHDT